MEIRQKKFSNDISYEFTEEKLKYTLREKGNRTTFSVEYGAIPLEFDELEERNEWFRNVGILWVIIGLFQKVTIFLQSGRIAGSFWLALGILCILAYKMVRTKFSIYQTNRGNIFVIHDKQRDLIVDEIKKRKKRQLLEWYGEINFENMPEDEINKFKWLRSEEVISESEMNSAIEKISKAKIAYITDADNENLMLH